MGTANVSDTTFSVPCETSVMVAWSLVPVTVYGRRSGAASPISQFAYSRPLVTSRPVHRIWPRTTGGSALYWTCAPNATSSPASWRIVVGAYEPLADKLQRGWFQRPSPMLAVTP